MQMQAQVQEAVWEVPRSMGRKPEKEIQRNEVSVRGTYRPISLGSVRHGSCWTLRTSHSQREHLIHSKHNRDVRSYYVRKQPGPDLDVLIYSTHSWTKTSNQVGLLFYEQPSVKRPPRAETGPEVTDDTHSQNRTADQSGSIHHENTPTEPKAVLPVDRATLQAPSTPFVLREDRIANMISISPFADMPTPATASVPPV
jgi:hypothetical protein